MKAGSLVVLALLAGRCIGGAAGSDPDGLAHVDPLIGTEGVGTQYGGMMPYAGVPFGSFHAVPMTRTNAIGRLSFNSSDETLLGVILTRQPAIWMGDWGEVRIGMPPAKIESLDAKPYLTRVTAGGRTCEFTATAHAAWIRGLDEATVAAFPGTGVNTNRMDAKYGYPLPNFGGRWFADKSRPGELRIGLSLISVEQAKANLADEIGSRTFGEVVAETKARWEEMFSRVRIDAPDDVKTVFYTGLYHTLLYPRQMDEGGRYYSAFDDRVHEGTRYNCFSLWDTYRAEHPWLTLVAPERVDGMMQSLVDMYREGGWLPKWPNPSYTGIMVGAPAEVVLAEAYLKGFRGFDVAGAYEAVRKNATVPQEGDEDRTWGDRGQFGRTPETRAGLTSYLRRGYVSCDRTRESVSRTQDFGQADLAAAILAGATGHAEEATMFRARSRNYTNLWNAAAKVFCPRRADGTFGDATDKGHYCEQTAQTAVWAVPYDVSNLVTLLGGAEEATRRLDDYFDRLFWVPERGNKSIHGNEPSHHCSYLYNRFGHPEKTQQRVREIQLRSYSTNRKGFDGNEDCGQMSAWYILSALGFYPLDPSSGEYEIGSPLVKSAILRFGAPYAQAELRIRVDGYSPTRWRVARVRLNGVELANWRVRHADLVKGGELVYEMADADTPAYDLVIYGSSPAAVTAAVRASDRGLRTVVVSPEKHIGGLSVSGLGYTDSGNTSAIGGLARDFYRRIYRAYQDPAAWKWEKMSDFKANGQATKAIDHDGKVMWTFEPHVAERVFADWLKEKSVEVRRGEFLDRETGVRKQDGRIVSITTLAGNTYAGRYFIDATYEGDLMAAAGVPYRVGREDCAEFGEKWNGNQPGIYQHGHHFRDWGISPYKVPGDPSSGLCAEIDLAPPGVRGTGDRRVQAYCYRLCMTDDPRNRLPFVKPVGYDPSRYELLRRAYERGYNETFRKYDRIANHKTDTNNHGPMGFDWLGGSDDWPEATYARRREIARAHYDYQMGLLYFLANDPGVPEKVRTAMSRWGLAADEFADNGGWPYHIYVREGRRMVGEYVMTEHDCLGEPRHAAQGTPRGSVGMGSYCIDSHNVRRYVTAEGHVQNEGDIGVSPGRPYPIDYGSIIPRRTDCRNLLVPVAVSATHTAFGSIRMEPVFMVLGESAATAAALAAERDLDVQDVPPAALAGRLRADRQILELE